MRSILFSVLALALTGCVNFSDPLGNRAVEGNLIASCQNWDNNAQAAAHPDAAMIARHDALLAKADAIVQSGGDIGTAAQDQVEADAIYDVAGKQKIADQCWAELGMVREMHADMAQRMQAVTQPSPAPAQSFMPNPDVYRRSSPVPDPIPPSDLGQAYVPPSPPPPQHCIGQIPVNANVAMPCP